MLMLILCVVIGIMTVNRIEYVDEMAIHQPGSWQRGI